MAEVNDRFFSRWLRLPAVVISLLLLLTVLLRWFGHVEGRTTYLFFSGEREVWAFTGDGYSEFLQISSGWPRQRTERKFHFTKHHDARRYGGFYFKAHPAALAGWVEGKEYRVNFTHITLPYWFMAMMTGALPFTILVRRVKRRLAWRRAGRLGLCRQCGYDLRCSVERCPECGMPFDGTSTEPS